MSPAEIEKLKALEREATPGPWRLSKTHAGQYNGRAANVIGADGECVAAAWIWLAEEEPEALANAGLILARNALPRLLEERERLLEALRGLLAWAESPATRAVESCAWVHGVKYTAEDVAAWDTARTQRAFAEAPTK